jgi:hypothetical protein
LQKFRIRVWPQREWAAAAGSDLCPGRKAFELYYVILHHPRQTEDGLTRRTSDRLPFDRDDAFLHNTVRRLSRHSSPLSVWPDPKILHQYQPANRRH